MIVRIFWGAKVRKKNEWGGNKMYFLVERNILVRYFTDFISIKSTIKQHFIHIMI